MVGHTIQEGLVAPALIARSSELLQEERRAVDLALTLEGPCPIQLHPPGAGTRLPADDHPLDFTAG